MIHTLLLKKVEVSLENDMEWFAVRNIYHCGTNKNNNKNIFEERIVCFYVLDTDEAHARGAIESEEYAHCNNFKSIPEQLVYKQDGEKLIDGYELWSELYESDLTLEGFYMARYTKYIYNPDTDGIVAVHRNQ